MPLQEGAFAPPGRGAGDARSSLDKISEREQESIGQERALTGQTAPCRRESGGVPTCSAR